MSLSETLDSKESTLVAIREPAMRQANAVSFDDLLVLPVEILRANPHVLEQYHNNRLSRPRAEYKGNPDGMRWVPAAER